MDLVCWETEHFLIKIPKSTENVTGEKQDWNRILHDVWNKERNIQFKQGTDVDLDKDKQTEILKMVGQRWHNVIKKNKNKAKLLLVDCYIKTLKNYYNSQTYSQDLKSKLGLYEFRFPIWVVSAWLRDYDDPRKHSKGRKFKYPDICFNFLDEKSFTESLEMVDGAWKDMSSKTEDVDFDAFVSRNTKFFERILKAKPKNAHFQPQTDGVTDNWQPYQTAIMRHMFDAENRRQEVFIHFLNNNLIIYNNFQKIFSNLTQPEKLAKMITVFTLRARVAWFTLIRAITQSKGPLIFRDKMGKFNIDLVQNNGKIPQHEIYSLKNPQELRRVKFEKGDAKHSPYYVKNFQILGEEMLSNE